MGLSKLWFVVLIAGCAVEESSTSTTDQSVTTSPLANGGSVTRIKVNGNAATAFFVDTDLNGGIDVSRDNVAHTSAMDFSWAFPSPADPNIAVLIQGAGEIPNSALTSTDDHDARQRDDPVPRQPLRDQLDHRDGKPVRSPPHEPSI